MKKILLILLSIFFLSCGVKNSNDNEHIFYSLINVNYLLILLIIQSKIQAPTTDTKIL